MATAGGTVETIPYSNVPRSLAMVISHRMATMHELDTVYGVEDLYDMLEILVVDSYNKSLAYPEDES